VVRADGILAETVEIRPLNQATPSAQAAAAAPAMPMSLEILGRICHLVIKVGPAVVVVAAAVHQVIQLALEIQVIQVNHQVRPHLMQYQYLRELDIQFQLEVLEVLLQFLGIHNKMK
jgi:hypothetical protein